MAMRFDESLPALVDIISTYKKGELLSNGAFLRDINGRLSFFLSKKIPKRDLEKLTLSARKILGAYARPDRTIVSNSEFGSEGILTSPAMLAVKVNERTIRLIDRRLVGADWLRAPAPKVKSPPRFVFASLKGGVGRSTALSITASYLASRGKRVLAIDLDLEAPGLGSLLLDDLTLPSFGLIDALVENGLSPLDNKFFSDMIGPSNLGPSGGKIDVIPAFGKKSLDNPSEILSKLARAYADDIREDGTSASIMDQISEIINRFSDPTLYDAILIDARAGLHETTATAILGLGAEVFLFGLDEPQTFQGYSALLSHIVRFQTNTKNYDKAFLDNISMVHGKAPSDPIERSMFAEKCKQLFIKCGIGGEISSIPIEPQAPAEPFNNVPWDDDISDDLVLPDEIDFFREPAIIFDSELFKNFNPRLKRDLLLESVYSKIYESFLDRITESFPELRRVNNAQKG